MEYFTCGQVNKVVGAPKEYNMWGDNIWKDAPRISPTETGWMDIPRNSPKTLRSPQKSTPPTSSPKSHCETPKKSQTPPLDDLDTSPRTSTPVPDESLEDIVTADNNKDQYECFKEHLESPRKLKLRGAVCYDNDTIICGHIDMKHLEPFSYTFEHHYMPKLNTCFVNLLLNGPAPLMCHEHYDPNYPNNYVSNCQCLPVCNCRMNLATNMHLPIGYKYNENGFVIPNMPSMLPRPQRRDPSCIYTI